MGIDVPSKIPREALTNMIVALADDELVLGHRDSEWTGHAPILEEDIAFSNIAQDEIGHALAWFTLHGQLTGTSPDWMGFERPWSAFTCCRFVAYPKNDFAYTVVRQYLFDAAEQIRLRALMQGSFAPIAELADKMLREERYHLLHSCGLVERLGDATEESHRRMQAALDQAFPQALGMFEEFVGEPDLVSAQVIPPSVALRNEWLDAVVPILKSVSLPVPAVKQGEAWKLECDADEGGRQRRQTDDLKNVVADMQRVYAMSPGGSW
jgi:ring-1,2-phenylacetyl-CoA epoxidase subunit PaaC